MCGKTSGPVAEKVGLFGYCRLARVVVEVHVGMAVGLARRCVMRLVVVRVLGHRHPDEDGRQHREHVRLQEGDEQFERVDEQREGDRHRRDADAADRAEFDPRDPVHVGEFGAYLASPDAGWISGQTFQVRGGVVEHVDTWTVRDTARADEHR